MSRTPTPDSAVVQRRLSNAVTRAGQPLGINDAAPPGGTGDGSGVTGPALREELGLRGPDPLRQDLPAQPPGFRVLKAQVSSAASMSRRYWLDTLAISSPLGSNLKTSSESHPR